MKKNISSFVDKLGKHFSDPEKVTSVPKKQKPKHRYASIDALKKGHVSGWIKHPDHDQSMQIDIYVNDFCAVANHLADAYREDLEKAGFGHGRYGFLVPLTTVPEIQEDTVTLFIRESGKPDVLVSKVFKNIFKASPRLADPPAVPSAVPPPSSSAAPVKQPIPQLRKQRFGTIDALKKGHVSGWIKHPDHDQSMQIDIYVNDFCAVANHLADAYREDLEKAGFGHGRYGFLVPLTTVPEIQEDTVTLFIRESGKPDVLVSKVFDNIFKAAPVLTDSLVVSSAAPPESSPASFPTEHSIAEPRKKRSGSLDALKNGYVSGWIKHPDHDQSFQIDIYVNDFCAVENYLADAYREDLEKAGIGHGRYGFLVPLVDVPEIQGDTVTIATRESGKPDVLISKNFKNIFKAEYLLGIEKVDENSIAGWCVNKNKRDDVFDIELYVDGFLFSRLKTNKSRGDLKNKNLSAGRGGFSIDNPLRLLGYPRSCVIHFRLPDGTLSKNYTVASGGKYVKRVIDDVDFFRRDITIIVPIYNAPEDVEICIERLLAYTPAYAKILLIDDASSDPAIAGILSGYESVDRIKILHNEENMGFVRTVNRGIAETGRDDVVLLNSDARVTPGWLEGLLIAASSSPRIATVTPMSDRAGAFSSPVMGNENDLPEGVDEITYAKAFRRHSAGLYPTVPTGNGFCMYIRRACIEDIGIFDAEAFPRGYGEENDFCMRALHKGWKNIIDDCTYVFHDRSKSFGEEKDDLLEASKTVIRSRYPEYKKAIRVFTDDEKITLARYSGLCALRDCVDGIGAVTRVLFVVSTRTGGTPQTNDDLMDALSDATENYLFRCDRFRMELSLRKEGKTYLVRTHILQDPVDPVSHMSPEYDAVIARWLFDFDIDLVHIRHISWHSLGLPYIVKTLGKKLIFSFHDYYVLTPTVNMVDDTGAFCGNTFFEEGSRYTEGVWPPEVLPQPSEPWLSTWRAKFGFVLKHCDAFVTTSKHTRAMILTHLPELPADRFWIIPHGRDFDKFFNLGHPPQHGVPLRILVPGNIGVKKGLDVIDALGKQDKANLIEFHVLGPMQKEKREKNPGIVEHGRYARSDFSEKASAIKPHIGAVFSVWDETHCHTLTELWAMGLPVIVFDFPTVAGRVRRSGAGWVLDHRNIPKLYEEILRLAFDNNEQNRVRTAVFSWRSGEGIRNTSRVMAAGYFDIYRKLFRGKKTDVSTAQSPRIAVVCPGSRDLKRSYSSTHIRIWERTRNQIGRDLTYIRMLPETALANIKERTVDGVIIQRTAIPRTLVNEFLEACMAMKIPYLLDLDDDLLNVPQEKDPRGIYADYREHLQKLIIHASMLSVSTPALVETYRCLKADVIHLPNRLSDRLWCAPPLDRIAENNIVRAIYMGTNTHGEDLNMILPALDAVAESEPCFRLALVGIDPGKTILDKRKRWLEQVEIPPEKRDYDKFVPWLKGMAGRFDFGIAPLTDSLFNEKKSPLKLFDYAGLGLPVLASDLLAYRFDARADAPGLRRVPNTTEKWAQALEEQIRLGPENCEWGKRQRQWVLENHMLNATLPEFDAIMLRMVYAR